MEEVKVWDKLSLTLNLNFRTPRTEGAEEGGTVADEDHKQSPGPRDVQCGGATKAALL